jgi:hypothetical protein
MVPRCAATPQKSDMGEIALHVYAGLKMKVRGKVCPATCNVGQRCSRDISVPILNLGNKLSWMVSATLRPLYPCPRAPVTIVEGGCGSGQSDTQERMSFPSPGFKPLTVQPITSPYTDYIPRPLPCAVVGRLYMIYLLTAIGLTPGGSSTVHIYTQTPGGSSTVHIYIQTVHTTTN